MGYISGNVSIGIGHSTGASLETSVGASKSTRLTILRSLTFKGDGIYTCQLNTRKSEADRVIANGVIIDSAAQFSLETVGSKRLPDEIVFTVISNTAPTPIAGTFANLPDGATVTTGRNHFQASYEGGDGNDLTLSTVP